MVCIPLTLYKKLVYKSEQYDKMKEIAQEMEVEREDDDDDVPQLPRMPDDKRGGGKEKW